MVRFEGGRGGVFYGVKGEVVKGVRMVLMELRSIFAVGGVGRG